MQSITGANLFLKILYNHGVKVVSGIPGGAVLPLYNELYSSPIKHVLAKNEQGAGFIVQGMTRVSGKLGVCIGTSGPGICNLITPIADAYCDSIPMLAIMGQVHSKLIGTDAFQEIDNYGLTIPITKHNFYIRKVEDILTVVPEAIRLATSGRPGPVAIDFPKDIQLMLIDVDINKINTDSFLDEKNNENQSINHEKRINIILEKIKTAKKPILYIGGGIITSKASEEIRELALNLNLPVVSTLMGLGAVDVSSDLYLGMLGMHAAPYTNFVLDKADLLISIGVRFDDRATGKLNEFCSNADVIHIDIDKSEIGKLKRASVHIVGDAKDIIKKIIDRVNFQTSLSSWWNEISDIKNKNPMVFPNVTSPISAYGSIYNSYKLAISKKTCIVTTDVGQHQMWAAQVIPFSKPNSWLTSGGLGTMGFGIPASIGAAIADEDAIVLCITGDGSILMNIQELATISELRLNIKILLLNNNHLGLVRQQQELFYSQQFSECEFGNYDFVSIAKAFGIQSCNLNKEENPSEKLFEIMNDPLPYLINVDIEKDCKVFPMVAPGESNTSMITE